MQLPFDLGFPGLLRHYGQCIMASEDDHLHLSCESSDSEEDKTLPENASKQYGLQPYQPVSGVCVCVCVCVLTVL